MAVNHVRLCKVWATLCTCFWRRVFVATSFWTSSLWRVFENPVTTGCTGAAAPAGVAGA